MQELTREQYLVARTKYLVGKRVTIKEIVNPMIPQVAVGMKGKVISVTPSNAFPINVRLDGSVTLGFSVDEIELTN